MADSDQQPPVMMAQVPGGDLPPERRFYFNGLAISLTATDVVIAFMQEGRMVCVGTTSYTMAKTLSQQLARIVDIVENKIGLKVLTLDEMQAELTKQASDLK